MKHRLPAALAALCLTLAVPAKAAGPATTPPAHCDVLHLLPGCQPSKLQAALAKPFQDFAALLKSDFAGAAALAVAVPGLEDGNGQACWVAMQNYSKVIEAHPIPLSFQVATDFEAFRLMQLATAKLCQSKECTQVFQDAANFANAVQPGLPLPSFGSLCAKIPTIAQAPAAPAAAVIATPVNGHGSETPGVPAAPVSK